MRTATTRDDAVRETALGVYAENSLEWTPWLRSVAGVRADHFHFDVASNLAANSGRTSATQVSPKLSLIFGPWSKTEFFVNAGRGFHSNDARGTTTTIDPRTGDPATPVPGLAASKGWEIGARTEALPGLQSSLAAWELRSDSELVYVGDAGTTEASRPSRRIGVEWNNRWIPVPWFLLDADLAWTKARFRDFDPAGDRIPGAVERVASVAMTLRDLGPWSASLQWRYLGARPLVEDNSVRAPSTLLTNLRVARKIGPDIDADARRLQPARPQGQRHRIFLRVAARGRSGAGGRPAPASGRAEDVSRDVAGAVLTSHASRAPHGDRLRHAGAL